MNLEIPPCGHVPAMAPSLPYQVGQCKDCWFWVNTPLAIREQRYAAIAQEPPKRTPQPQQAIGIARLKCIHKGEKIPGKPCGTDLYRCNYDAVTCSPLGNCSEASRSCQSCGFFELASTKAMPLQLAYGEACLKFSHYGDYGDVLYSLSSVYDLCRRDNCQAEFILYEIKGTRELMTAKHAAIILPLIEIQPYIALTEWQKERTGIALDTAVRKFHNTNGQLADHYQNWLNIPYGNRLNPWLRCGEPNKVAKYVFNRTVRYRGKSFPWKDIVAATKGEAVFIGTHAEHAEFKRDFGDIPYYRTPTLLDAANVIAGSELFVGNQSSCRAIAEGLKHPVAVEEGQPPDTHFVRPNAWYGTEEMFWCPLLPDRYKTNPVTVPATVVAPPVTVAANNTVSLTQPQRLQVLEQFLRDNDHRGGCVVEVGVYEGGSLAHLAKRFPNKKFVGFDTFAGLPLPTDKDNFHEQGEFTADYETVAKSLSQFPNVMLHKGVFPSPSLPIPDYILLAFVDVDLYESTLGALRALWPKLLPGGRIYCDDAFFPTCTGATIALVEFCKEMGIPLQMVKEQIPVPFGYVEKPLETHERNVQSHPTKIAQQPIRNHVLCGPGHRRGGGG